jgi:hypothetical protein
MDDITPLGGQETTAATDQTQSPAAPAAAAPQGKPVTLSDGRIAVVRRGKGRDLLEASRRAGTDVSRMQFELLSVLTSIDGQLVPFDDLMAMDMEDVTDLLAATGSAESGFTKAATSST